MASPELTRIGVACIVLNMFREALEKNNNVYNGSLVPNLMSIQDVLTLPDAVLKDQLAHYPAILPSVEQLVELKKMHEG